MRVKVINKRPASVLQKKRVCAYARVSTDSRRQEDSLENQMETYERLITGNPEYEFIGVFADQGISGYCENRPQFQRMMEKTRAGEIDLIITKSISRFARNTVTVLKFARELKELGVEKVYTGHCTGMIAFGIMKRELGNMVHALNTGCRIEI